MLRVVRRKSLGVASLVLVAGASGCGDDQGASESKHGHGGSSGSSGAANGGSTAGSAGVATGGAGGRAGAGAAGVMTGGGAGRGGGSGGTAGVSGDAGAGGETDGGQGGEGLGGEGGAVGGEGGTAGTGASGGMGGAGGSGGLSGSGGISGSSGAGGSAGMAGMSGVGGLGGAGAGAGGAGTGGAGAGNAGGGGTGGAGIPGLDVPCQNGPGWTLFRWHYAGSTTPSVDVWDATCSYSASASSTCTIETVESATLTQGGTAIVIAGSNELRARYSVQGLTFTGAAVYVRARSFSTNASTNIRVASVLHGESVMGPVDQDFTYDWYGMDWTGKVLATDTPGLTALRIYPYQGANSLAIMSVELCVR